MKETDNRDQVRGDTSQRFEDVVITEEMVAKKIDKLKENNAQGRDLLALRY